MSSILTVIGHRGAAGHAAENTFAAFDVGLRMGVDGVETDIRRTSDGVLVLIHDATVDRTTDGHGPVAEMTLTHLQTLDAGVRFGPQFTGQRIPTLESFLERYRGRTRFRLEFKIGGVEEQVLDVLRRHEVLPTSMLTSFDLEILRALHRLEPTASLAWITNVADAAEAVKAREAGCAQICYRSGEVTRALVDNAHERGLEVWGWSIKTRDLLERAVREGVDGVTLDEPDWADGIRTRADATR